MRRHDHRHLRIWLPIAMALAAFVPVSTNGPRFFSDDPITKVPEAQDASGAKPVDIGLLYEISYNLFVTAKYKPTNTRALNINTIDEVPDSSWFTNRIGAIELTPERIEKGPAVGAPPSPERWVVIREKSGGMKPGFTARDANGETWFLEFDDSPANPEGPTGATIVASKLFWALGYNEVETFLTTLDPAKVVIDPKATKRRPNGKRTPFTEKDLHEVLDVVKRSPDGTFRVTAGRLIPGKILGGFRYAGTRPDDPNDIVPHEHRRELRALRVFGAWTNLTDLKAGNTLDTLVTENGHAIVKHVLQDVGSTFGMANGEHEWDIGWEHFYEGGPTLKRLFSFGFALSPWQTVHYQEYPSINRFEGDRFDPREWRPQTPTTAYMELRADDAFWAARRVVAFTDDQIRAAVHAGKYSDAAAAQHLAAVIGKRRDKIGQIYLTAINPIVNPRLDTGGTLTFENAAASYADAPTGYRAVWSRFDNATGSTSPIAETKSATTTMAGPRDLPTGPESFVEIDISADSAGHPTWQEPIHTYFRRTADGWKLVGLERLPDKPATAQTQTAKD